MRRLVFITQHVDSGHPALAATVPKLRALAERVDELVVLADGVVPGTLPANCRVHRFAAPTKLGRGLRFEQGLLRELVPRPSGVVAHMCPIYAVLAAPVVRPLGIPLVLWFTHWRASPLLRAAERASTRVATVDRRSFPLESAKVRAIGHGIDVAEFDCRPRSSRDGLGVLVLGRYSPAKGLDVVLRALRRALDSGLDVRLEAHGPATTPPERAHRAELERLVAELRLGDRVVLGDAVPRAQVPDLLAANDVLVNAMREGALDKVVYEAAASCVPVLASNTGFDTLLPVELRFAREEPAELAHRLQWLAGQSRDEREHLGRTLREAVVREHSVDTWADRILGFVR